MKSIKTFLHNNKPAAIILSILLVILAILIIFTLYRSLHPPIYSPIASGQLQITQSAIPNYVNSIKYGFLPFWNLNSLDPIDIETYTHIAYFALDVDADGSIKTHTNPGESDPGWYHYQNTLPQKDNLFTNPNIETHLVYKVPNDSTLETVIASPSARAKLVDTIITTTVTSGFTGINIDFEPTARPNQNTRDNFTDFINQLNFAAKNQSPPLAVVIDIYANAARRSNLWDLPRLETHTDYFIFMAYDYHRTNSPIAGPVAPLYPDPNNPLDYAIINDLAILTQVVPTEKIIIGIPLYGYQWQVSTEGNLAHTYPKTGLTLTNQELTPILNQPNQVTRQWNPHTLTPWFEFTKNQNTYHVHYDNHQSIGFKNELILLSGLAGSAHWAVGY